MIKKILLGALLLDVVASSANAENWTRTVDYSVWERSIDARFDTPQRTAAAYWLDLTTPIDPLTGTQLSPFDVPEKVIRGKSSRYGELWPDSLLGYWVFYPDYKADVNDSLWAVVEIANAGSVAMGVKLVPVDGAQIVTLTAADLGHPSLAVLSVEPLIDVAGALAVVGHVDQPNAETHVVRLDARGNRLTSTPASGCTSEALDDRHGGYYAICKTATYLATIRRVAASPADSWATSTGIHYSKASSVSITPSGGLLVRSPDYVQMRVLDASGNLKFALDDDLVATAGGAFWTWRDADRRLRHLNADGVELASAFVTRIDNMSVLNLLAHESGSALLSFGYLSPFGLGVERSDLYSSAVSLVRRIGNTSSETHSRSLTAFAGDSLIAREDGVSLRAQVLDRDGARSSAPFLNEMLNAEHPQKVSTDGTTLCTRDYDGIVLIPYVPPITRISCYDYRTGARQLERTFSGEARLEGLGPNVFVSTPLGTHVFSPLGPLLATIDTTRPQVFSFDVDPRHGLAATATDGAVLLLKRYRNDGSLAFSIQVPGGSGGERIVLASDGSTLVIGHRVRRYGADGVLIGDDLGLSPVAGQTVIDAHVGTGGVQFLLGTGSEQFRYPTEIGELFSASLVVLSSDLTQVRSSQPLGRAWADHATMWPSSDGDPRIALANSRGLRVFQFDSRTGVLRNRRVFDAGSPEQMHAGVVITNQGTGAQDPLYSRRQNRYDIDADGRVRLLAFDPFLKRDVLRIFEPPAATFSGPIAQRALAASWFSPSSSGQGLLLEMLNHNSVLFAAWHTFAPEGGRELSKQQWFTLNADIGAARGKIIVPIYRNGNGRFDLEGSTAAQAVGSAELVFTDCDHLEFWYRIGDDAGAFPMQRLTPRTLACDDGTQIVQSTDLPAGIDLSGAWYDPARSGQGFTFNATGARFKSFLAGWFTYDAEGAVDDPDAQHWFTLQGATPDRYGQPIAAKIHRTIGGSRAGAPTQNSHQVGNAMLTVHDCATATLEYVFDDSALAGAFADRSRAVQLKRLGACPN